MSGVPTPRGWQAMTFADVVVQGEDAIVGGPFGSSLTTADYVDAGVPVIRGSNLAGEECRFVDNGFVYVSAQKAEELARNTARPGDMIFTQRGTLGQVAVIPRVARFDRYIVSQSQMRVRVREDRFLPRFLYWYYRSPVAIRYLESRTLATGVPHINLGILKEFPVMAPDLPEQCRIAAILDEADALRRRRREAVALVDDLLRATFLDMFGDPVTNPRRWQTVPLGEVVEVQGGLQVTAQRAEPLEVPYLRVANVYRERLDLREIKSIRVTAAERERVRLRYGDVLVVEGHGNPDEVGRAAVWDRPDEMMHQNHLIRVRADPARLDPWYLSAYLNSSGGRRQMVRAGKTTSGLNTISTSNVKATKVLLPPLGVQEPWSRFVRACAAERERSAHHTEHVDFLFSSLLHRAFAGELGPPRRATFYPSDQGSTSR